MREGCLGNMIVLLEKCCQSKGLKVTFFSQFHSLVGIGKTTYRQVEKKG